VDVVLAINKQISLFCDLKKVLHDKVSLSSIDYIKQVDEMKKIELNKEILKYQNLINELLKEYKNNIILESDYIDFKEHYLYELNKLRIEREKLDNNDYDSRLSFLKKIKKYKDIDKLNRNIINEFIDNIYVDKNKNIKIVFRFQDEYEQLLRYINDKKV